jgi:hypothetical protein
MVHYEHTLPAPLFARNVLMPALIVSTGASRDVGLVWLACGMKVGRHHQSNLGVVGETIVIAAARAAFGNNRAQDSNPRSR